MFIAIELKMLLQMIRSTKSFAFFSRHNFNLLKELFDRICFSKAKMWAYFDIFLFKPHKKVEFQLFCICKIKQNVKVKFILWKMHAMSRMCVVNKENHYFFSYLWKIQTMFCVELTRSQFKWNSVCISCIKWESYYFDKPLPFRTST